MRIWRCWRAGNNFAKFGGVKAAKPRTFLNPTGIPVTSEISVFFTCRLRATQPAARRAGILKVGNNML